MMFVVVVVGSKAIHKHFTFMPKMRLQSEWEKWGANLKHTQKETRVQWHQNQSQSSCQKKLFFLCIRFKWSVNAVRERYQYIWYFIYMHYKPCILRCNQCWHSIRGFAWNHSHHHHHQYYRITAHTNVKLLILTKEEQSHLMQFICIPFLKLQSFIFYIFSSLIIGCLLIFFLSSDLLENPHCQTRLTNT